MIEELLKTFVGVVDAQLFEAVELTRTKDQSECLTSGRRWDSPRRFRNQRYRGHRWSTVVWLWRRVSRWHARPTKETCDSRSNKSTVEHSFILLLHWQRTYRFWESTDRVGHLIFTLTLVDVFVTDLCARRECAPLPVKWVRVHLNTRFE